MLGKGTVGLVGKDTLGHQKIEFHCISKKNIPKKSSKYSKKVVSRKILGPFRPKFPPGQICIYGSHSDNFRESPNQTGLQNILGQPYH